MKILVFLPRFPYPLNKGDKLRAFNQIKELAKNNDVFLFSLTHKTIKDDYIKELKQYCKQIHVEKLSLFAVLFSLIKSIFSRQPLQVALFTTKKSKRRFQDFFSKTSPDISYFQFVRSAEYAKEVSLPRVLDFQDCLSINILRRANISNIFDKLVLSNESKRLTYYENNMFDIFSALTIITAQDRDCLQSNRKNEVHIIENGVSQSYFIYNKTFEKKYDIIFSGNMSYKPNIVAAKYLIREIMPIVWKKMPKAKVVLAGSNPTKELQALSNENVIVTGWVDDMRDYYAQSRIFIAPMQIGSGLQNKLLEAMAMSLPCITTPIAFAAIDCKENEDILVADNSKDLADNVVALLTDEVLYSSIAKNGNAFVQNHFSWQQSTAKLENIFRSCISK